MNDKTQEWIGATYFGDDLFIFATPDENRMFVADGKYVTREEWLALWAGRLSARCEELLELLARPPWYKRFLRRVFEKALKKQNPPTDPATSRAEYEKQREKILKTPLP